MLRPPCSQLGEQLRGISLSVDARARNRDRTDVERQAELELDAGDAHAHARHAEQGQADVLEHEPPQPRLHVRYLDSNAPAQRGATDAAARQRRKPGDGADYGSREGQSPAPSAPTHTSHPRSVVDKRSRAAAKGTAGAKKNPVSVDDTGPLGKNPGDVLLSHTASRAVPLAPKSLTSEFGMGSGVASSKTSPEICDARHHPLR